MKKMILAALLVAVVPNFAVAEPLCEVKVCNRLKRFSINPFSHLKDKFGEECYDAKLPKSEAVEGRELSSSSRWYQGHTFNPTKRSVTYVKEVGVCR